jgi:hypothetical protein
MRKFAITALLAAVAMPLTFAAQAPAGSSTDTTTKTEKAGKKKHHKKAKKTAAAKPAPAVKTAVK